MYNYFLFLLLLREIVRVRDVDIEYLEFYNIYYLLFRLIFKVVVRYVLYLLYILGN